MYGVGGNGKTGFIETLTALIGGYGTQAQFSTFLKQENQSIRNDIAALKGARFVAASESGEGARLDEAVIKEITGGGHYYRPVLTSRVF
jgi:putative DNA primase/helicase